MTIPTFISVPLIALSILFLVLFTAIGVNAVLYAYLTSQSPVEIETPVDLSMLRR